MKNWQKQEFIYLAAIVGVLVLSTLLAAVVVSFFVR